MLSWMENVSACVPTCLKACGVRTSREINQEYQVRGNSGLKSNNFLNFCCLHLNCTIYNDLQLQDLLSPRKGTGRAGQAGPAAKGRSAAGHATVTKKGSLELSATGSRRVKNTAKPLFLCQGDTWKTPKPYLQQALSEIEPPPGQNWILQLRKLSQLIQ